MTIFFIFLLSILSILEKSVIKDVSCASIGKIDHEESIDYLKSEYREEDNSILDEVRNRDAKPSILRSKRDLGQSIEESNSRSDYESAINQTIDDYYAQRKAVMERYYARQREIVEKFRRKNDKSRKLITDTPRNFDDRSMMIDETRIVDNKTKTIEEDSGKIIRNDDLKSIFSDQEINYEDKKDVSISEIYRSRNSNLRDLGYRSDNRGSDSSNTEIPGYYKLGDFTGKDDEKVIYQHNLGVGLKGQSQLDATFEVILEGSFAITVVEAFPYAQSRANFSWVDGGPGSDFVKLKLKGYENKGFSYTVKVWGVPK